MKQTPKLMLFSISLVLSRPSDDVQNEVEEENHSSSSSNVVSTWGEYQVSVNKNLVDGKCLATLTLRGPGMEKEEEYPCPEQPVAIIVMGGSLLVGDRYFSDTPGELVHLEGDKCEKEVFTEKDGKFTSELKPMESLDCEKVKAKAEMLQKQQKEWMKWIVEYQNYVHQQLIDAKMSMQQMFSTLFGWGS